MYHKWTDCPHLMHYAPIRSFTKNNCYLQLNYSRAGAATYCRWDTTSFKLHSSRGERWSVHFNLIVFSIAPLSLLNCTLTPSTPAQNSLLYADWGVLPLCPYCAILPALMQPLSRFLTQQKKPLKRRRFRISHDLMFIHVCRRCRKGLFAAEVARQNWDDPPRERRRREPNV